MKPSEIKTVKAKKSPSRFQGAYVPRNSILQKEE